ncbi:MAG TPA: HAD-IIA family hydrolase [Anaerolineales bacterium]|nr:HAD-IIA family hydrolase [Anaerolineales bacterium]
MHALENIQHLVIDMDGVLYRGDTAMPRLGEFISFLREESIQFILATNNSTKTPLERVEKLAEMGVTVYPDEILNSGQATARFLAHEYPIGTRVHVFGTAALREALTDERFVIADKDVDLVVASMDRDVTFDKLARASLLIRGGARFIATNLDPTHPSELGLLPGTGTMISALQTASETIPSVIGKPEPTMFDLAMEAMQASRANTAMIGDRVDTDILGGKRAGIMTICVLSGSSNRAEAEAVGADLICNDIAELLDIWRPIRQFEIDKTLSGKL